MTLSKYDKANYIKHPVLTLTGDNYTVLEGKFTSANLLIKWHCSKIHTTPLDKQSQGKSVATVSTLKGICEKRVDTPMGMLFPEQYSLKIAVDNNKFVEPLLIGNVDYEYSLYFQNPSNVRMSQIEVWEFKQ